MSDIGHNNPPRSAIFAMSLEDVRLEAGNFLDGADIETQEQADAVGKIVGNAKRLKSDIDKARKEDKQPHLDACREVDAEYNPLIDTAQDIINAAQKPLTGWLAKVQAEQIREAELAAQAAHEARQKQIEDERAAAGNVDAAQAAREGDKAARALEAKANRAARAKPQVAGMGRAIGLRSKQVAVVDDYKALLLHIANTDKPALDAFLDGYAARSLPAKLPGVRVETEQVAA